MTTAVETYRLVFRGELASGVSLDDVKVNAAKLLKLTGVQVVKLLASRSTTLKRGLTPVELERYREILARAGLIVHAEAEQEELRFPSLLPIDEEAASSASTASTLVAPTVGRSPVAERTPPVERSTADGGARELALMTVPESPPPHDSRTSDLAPAPAEDEVVCPKCELRQQKRTLCRRCGVDMPGYLRAAKVAAQDAYRPPTQSLRTAVSDGLSPPWDTELWSFSFSGRIGRLRYLTWSMPVVLAGILVIIFATLMGVASHGRSAPFAMIVVGAVCLGICVYSIRLMALRLHDMGFSGWLGLLLLIPVIGAVMALVLMLIPGQRSDNDYGPKPSENSMGVVIGGLLVLAVWTWAFVWTYKTTRHPAPPPVTQDVNASS